MEYNDINAWIVAFVEGELGQEDFKRLEEWTFGSEEHRCYVRDCIETLLAASVVSNGTSFDSNKAFERFSKRVNAEWNGKEGNKASVRRLPRWVRYVAAAAVALLLVLPVGMYLKGRQGALEELKQICMEVPNGSQMTLTLPDGTMVRLNSGSKLTYSQGFGVTDRELMLNGEAYFKVTHRGSSLSRFILTIW